MVFIAIFSLYPLFFIALFTSSSWSALSNMDSGPFFLYMTLVALGSVWLFLREPRMIIKKHQMEPLSKTNPDIVRRIVELATIIKMKEVPIILRIPSHRKNADVIYTFGTWRKKYIAISENGLSMNRETLDIMLLHELGHIASGDIWKTGLATSYLKCFVIFIMCDFLTSMISMPIFIPKSFSIAIIWINLGRVLSVFILIIAIRLMYQIREYAADEYIIRYIGNHSLTRKSLMEFSVKTNHNNNNSNLLSKLLNWLPGYHPGIGTRIKAINDKSILDEQIPAFFLVLGLVIGQFTSLFGNVVIGRTIVGWLILIPPFCLSLTLNTNYSPKLKDKIWLSIRSIINLAIGASLTFAFYVLPSALFVSNPLAGNSILYSIPFDLQPYLSQFLDFIFIILFLIPIFLFFQTWVFEILSIVIYRITDISQIPFFAWLLQLPLNLFVFKSLEGWFLGQDILLETCVIFSLIWLVWGIGVVATVKIIMLMKRKGLDNAK